MSIIGFNDSFGRDLLPILLFEYNKCRRPAFIFYYDVDIVIRV